MIHGQYPSNLSDFDIVWPSKPLLTLGTLSYLLLAHRCLFPRSYGKFIANFTHAQFPSGVIMEKSLGTPLRLSSLGRSSRELSSHVT